MQIAKALKIDCAFVRYAEDCKPVPADAGAAASGAMRENLDEMKVVTHSA